MLFKLISLCLLISVSVNANPNKYYKPAPAPYTPEEYEYEPEAYTTPKPYKPKPKYTTTEEYEEPEYTTPKPYTRPVYTTPKPYVYTTTTAAPAPVAVPEILVDECPQGYRHFPQLGKCVASLGFNIPIDQLESTCKANGGNIWEVSCLSSKAELAAAVDLAAARGLVGETQFWVYVDTPDPLLCGLFDTVTNQFQTAACEGLMLSSGICEFEPKSNGKCEAGQQFYNGRCFTTKVVQTTENMLSGFGRTSRLVADRVCKDAGGKRFTVTPDQLDCPADPKLVKAFKTLAANIYWFPGNYAINVPGQTYTYYNIFSQTFIKTDDCCTNSAKGVPLVDGVFCEAPILQGAKSSANVNIDTKKACIFTMLYDENLDLCIDECINYQDLQFSQIHAECATIGSVPFKVPNCDNDKYLEAAKSLELKNGVATEFYWVNVKDSVGCNKYDVKLKQIVPSSCEAMNVQGVFCSFDKKHCGGTCKTPTQVTANDGTYGYVDYGSECLFSFNLIHGPIVAGQADAFCSFNAPAAARETGLWSVPDAFDAKALSRAVKLPYESLNSVNQINKESNLFWVDSPNFLESNECTVYDAGSNSFAQHACNSSVGIGGIICQAQALQMGVVPVKSHKPKPKPYY